MIQIERLTFTYPEGKQPVFRELSLSLQRGETLLVCGVSGSGKSTFLRTLNGLVPHFSGGKITGRVIVNGMDAILAGPALMSHQVGFVFQDPESQFVMQIVEDELAFGLENAGLPLSEIQSRINEILSLMGISQLKRRRLESLSGGEKQKVAVAAALVVQPAVLVLDEPTSQLDAQSAEELFQILYDLKHKLGLTLVISEHRLERLISFCDQMLIMNGGEDGWIYGRLPGIMEQAPFAPPIVELAKAINYRPIPLTLEQGRKMVQVMFPEVDGHPEQAFSSESYNPGVFPTHDSILSVKNLSVVYQNKYALKDINETIRKTELVAIIGRNGAGKTSLLRSIIGLVRPFCGKVLLNGEDISGLSVWERSRDIGYLPQDPNALLFADTVLEELEFSLKNFSKSKPRTFLLELLERLGLSNYANAYPRDLSVGERQRVALASILVMEPHLLLLDEPTRGLDYLSKQKLVGLLYSFQQMGITCVVVTHDVEFLVQFARRVIWLDHGEIIADGDPHKVLALNESFSPQMLRLFSRQGWLTVEEVMLGTKFRYNPNRRKNYAEASTELQTLLHLRDGKPGGIAPSI